MVSVSIRLRSDGRCRGGGGQWSYVRNPGIAIELSRRDLSLEQMFRCCCGLLSGIFSTSQETCREERSRDELFCVEWNVEALPNPIQQPSLRRCVSAMLITVINGRRRGAVTSLQSGARRSPAQRRPRARPSLHTRRMCADSGLTSTRTVIRRDLEPCGLSVHRLQTSVKAKFHYTVPTGPNQTRVSDKVRWRWVHSISTCTDFVSGSSQVRDTVGALKTMKKEMNEK